MAVINVGSLQGTGLLWVAILLIVVYVPTSCLLNYRKCSHIKGPWLAAISNLWLFRTTFQGRLYLDCSAELDKYGTFARVAPNKIITNDPDLWRFMSAPRSTFTKGSWYDSMTLDPRFKNSLSQRDDKEHNKLRAKMIRGYSGKDIPALESTVDQSIIDLVDLIRRETHVNRPVDIAQLSQFFTLDVLTHIAFGASFGYLSRNEDVFRYVQKMSEFLGILELGSNFPTILSILNSKLMSPMQPKPTDKSGMGAMIGVAKRVVNERFASDAKQQDDMMGSFIKNGMTVKEVEAESMLQILGGSDSTATAIRMVFLYILTNPTIHAKVTSELDAALAKNALSHPVVKSAESQTHLPYLNACIKEGLRMFPPLTGLLGKLSPPTGATWNGIPIPPGIEVCWNPRSMQRRPEIYGPDADIYRPERWLEAATASSSTSTTTNNNREALSPLSKMNQTLDLVFGSGKYGCLGKTVAWMELDKIFVALFQNFEFALCDPVVPVKTICHGVHVQRDMWVRVYERNRGKKEMAGLAR